MLRPKPNLFMLRAYGRLAKNHGCFSAQPKNIGNVGLLFRLEKIASGRNLQLVYGKKRYSSLSSKKSGKCSSQQLLIKPDQQYFGDCKSARTDMIIRKNKKLSYRRGKLLMRQVLTKSMV